jgi:hypothetical protein
MPNSRKQTPFTKRMHETRLETGNLPGIPGADGLSTALAKTLLHSTKQPHTNAIYQQIHVKPGLTQATHQACQVQMV